MAIKSTRRTTASLGLWIDESEKDTFLAVGGVLLEWDAVAAVVSRWRDMKAGFGLEPNAEVKWNLPSKHPTRDILKRSKLSTRDLSTEAVRLLASPELEVTFIVAVMFENRRIDYWRSFKWSKASVRDFYSEGLRYVLQRAAEEVVETEARGCVVICDTPELGNKKYEKSSIRRGPRVVEKTYAGWYAQEGVGVGPGKQKHDGPLKEARFHPSVLIADATYHDMLQIADTVVGVTRDWISGIRRKRPDEWVNQQMRALSSKFRARYGQPSFWGDGLVLWPWQKDLWQALKESME